jgi:hypothetical protein
VKLLPYVLSFPNDFRRRMLQGLPFLPLLIESRLKNGPLYSDGNCDCYAVGIRRKLIENNDYQKPDQPFHSLEQYGGTDQVIFATY